MIEPHPRRLGEHVLLTELPDGRVEVSIPTRTADNTMEVVVLGRYASRDMALMRARKELRQA